MKISHYLIYLACGLVVLLVCVYLLLSKPEVSSSTNTTQLDSSAGLSVVAGKQSATEQIGGKLLINEALRELFDSSLAKFGRHGLVDARHFLEKTLQASLSAPAIQQALNLFDRYLGYRQYLESAPVPKQTSLAGRMAIMRDARRLYLTEQEIAGLFGNNDRYDAFTVQRLRIMENIALSTQQKTAQIRHLEADLPEDLRAARQEPVKHLLLAEEEDALRKKGAGEQEIYALRAQKVGQAAADRLAQLDTEQAEWHKRISTFQNERQRILADRSLSTVQKQKALAIAQGKRFTPQEQLRLDAYIQP
ncbi:lipase secretion chaperone [Neisseriaceae bacterium TC5R-5]|nr:lipase secretion chaperone [Neisseriaceae bacterium TC5R-5]